MFFGRLLGRALLVLALLMASGEAVLALSPAYSHQAILTSDVWMLLLGHVPDAGFTPATVLLHWPAWTVFAPLGLVLALACRRRRRRRYRFR